MSKLPLTLLMLIPIFFPAAGRGQVTLVPQNASQLCWAASMEMILKYHDPTFPGDQCSIATAYQHLKGITPSCPLPCPADCELAVLNSLIPDDCNQPIDFSCIYYGSNMQNFSYFEALFSDYGYYAMEDQNLLSWSLLRNELNQCRPVILIYDAVGQVEVPNPNGGAAGVTPAYFTHAVVADGYDLSLSPDTLIHIQDPWDVCNGAEYYLNKVVLDGVAQSPTATLTVNEILSMVHHIAPRDTVCNTCDLFPPANIQPAAGPGPGELAELLKEYRQNFIGTSFGSGELNGDRVRGSFTKQHFPTPVEYLSYAYLNNPKKEGGLSYNNARFNTHIREVDYTVSEPDLVATIRCTPEENFCVVEKLSLRSKPLSRVVLAAQERLLLSNNPRERETAGLPATGFTLVRYPPYPFEFYRFAWGDQGYMAPVDVFSQYYFYGPDYEGEILAIPEQQVLEGLEKYTQDYAQAHEKGEKYVRKVENILAKGGYIRINKFLKK